MRRKYLKRDICLSPYINVFRVAFISVFFVFAFVFLFVCKHFYCYVVVVVDVVVSLFVGPCRRECISSGIIRTQTALI